MASKIIAIFILSLLMIFHMQGQNFSLKISGSKVYQSAKGFGVEYDGLYFEVLPTEKGSDFFMPSLDLELKTVKRLIMNLGISYGQYSIRTLAEDRKILGGPFPATKITTLPFNFMNTTIGISYNIVIYKSLYIRPLFGIFWQHGIGNNESFNSPAIQPDYEKRAWAILEKSIDVINQDQLYYECGVQLNFKRFSAFYKYQQPLSNSLSDISIEGQEVQMYSDRRFSIFGIGFEFLRF